MYRIFMYKYVKIDRCTLHLLYIQPEYWNLVGGIPTPLKNIKVNWDDDIPKCFWKKQKCSKPPTRNIPRTHLAVGGHS